MKPEEKKFFKLCYLNITRIASNGLQKGNSSVNDVMICFSKKIPPKRMLYYLNKWTDLGFYDYGTNICFGWFIEDKFPKRYLDLLEKENNGE